MTTNTFLRPIPVGIWVLGLVSMFMDISSEMIHSLLPLFLVGPLGASALMVGLIEGLAESTALIVKVFSGALSDYLGKRKALALFGYSLGTLTKMNHGTLLSLGLMVLIAADLVLAANDHLLTVAVGVSLWELHMGMTQGLLATMVAAAAPVELRGMAFGFFNLVSGIAMLMASAAARLLWDRFGPSLTFYAGSAFAALALLDFVMKAWRR